MLDRTLHNVRYLGSGSRVVSRLVAQNNSIDRLKPKRRQTDIEAVRGKRGGALQR